VDDTAASKSAVAPQRLEENFHEAGASNGTTLTLLERRKARRHVNEPYFFDATRGARTFGEIGHEVTLRRSTRVIVNKLSTMTQNSVHAARPLVARRSRTRSVKRTPWLICSPRTLTPPRNSVRMVRHRGRCKFWPHLHRLSAVLCTGKRELSVARIRPRRCAESEVRCVTVQGMKIDSGLIDVTIRRRVSLCRFRTRGVR